MTKSAAFVVVMAIVFATALFGQDPGVADTVRLGSTTSTTVPVYIFNDEPISKITIPLLIDGYSGWAVYNSISYVGSLLADPSVLDLRQAAVVETDTFSQAILLLEFEVGSGSSLPAGTGKLCDLVFTYRFGGTVALDTTTANGPVTLSITDGSTSTFVPQFAPGQITLSCNYGHPMGDIDCNTIVSVSDLLSIQKELYWHLGFFYPHPYAAFDLNCDRHADMRDVNYLADYLFQSGPAPCVCGNYSPAQYNDPGARDTMSVSSQTIMVGMKTVLQFNLSNDEAIRSFAFGLEWDGTATMERTYINYANSDWDSLTARVLSGSTIGDGYGFGQYDNGVNPDTFHLSNLTFGPNTVIQPGTGAIFFSRFMPLTPGTLTFHLRTYKTGAESMLIDVNGNTILPEFVSGVITIVPRPCGDADFSGVVTISDAVYLINYIFTGGPAPNPLLSGDADCNGIVTISDAVYLINFIFSGGPEPCAACP